MTATLNQAWVAEEEDVVPLLIKRLEDASLGTLGEQLEEALPYMEAHFRQEQEPDGLFDALRELAPRTDPRLRELAAEHGALLDASRSLLATVKACLRLQLAAQRGRAHLVASMRRHNKIETDLLHEVYQVDLGGW
jgi:hypothetical protein